MVTPGRLRSARSPTRAMRVVMSAPVLRAINITPTGTAQSPMGRIRHKKPMIPVQIPPRTTGHRLENRSDIAPAPKPADMLTRARAARVAPAKTFTPITAPLNDMLVPNRCLRYKLIVDISTPLLTNKVTR